MLLALSRGLGGGIERYLDTVEDRLRAGGGDVRRFDMLEPSTSLTTGARIGYTLRMLAAVRRLGPVDSVVAGHVNLVPAASVAARLTGARRIPVLFYGREIWTMRRILREIAHRDPLMYPVTISSFSAGTLATVGVAPILPPGLAPDWRARLIADGARRRPLAPVPTVFSVFRLNDWRSKGLTELVEAVTLLRRDLGPIKLVVAGTGPAPGTLHELVAAHDDLELHESPDDATLARLYAAADLFALCTRTRTTPPVSGEGFGIVLTEAQLAGCAVVGPASGGSRDAYQEGVTGRTPTDESPAALAGVLGDLLADRARLARMGRRAAEWAQAATDPESYTRLVMTTLTGVPPRTAAEPAVPAQSTEPRPRRSRTVSSTATTEPTAPPTSDRRLTSDR